MYEAHTERQAASIVHTLMQCREDRCWLSTTCLRANEILIIHDNLEGLVEHPPTEPYWPLNHRGNPYWRLEVMSLPDPFPRAPSRPPAYCLYFYGAFNQMCAIPLVEPYAGRIMIEYALEGLDWKWEDESTIIAEIPGGELKVKSDPLEDLMEFELSKQQKLWSIPYATQTNLDRVTGRILASPEPEVRKEKKAKKERPKRQEALTHKKPRNSNPDVITPAELAQELNVRPNKVRNLLRTHVQKPTGGWSWPVSEKDKLIKQLKELLGA